MPQNKKDINRSRRKFIRNSVVIGSSFFIVPRHVLGRGFVAPSDKLNIAGIGAGGKGASDLAEFAKSPNVNIVALCDVDDRQAVQSRKNFPKAGYYKDFRQWSISGHHELMLGAMLTCKFQYPEMSSTPVLQEIEKIRRNIWLELNNYLTPLEQINIVTSILYSYYGLKGSETNYREPNEFLLHKTLESKRGNQVSNGILYLILCELLDIPVRAIQIPKQFIVAYFKPGYSDENLPDPFHKIDFFIDPTTGQIFTHDDVTSYFKRINVPSVAAYFKPQKNKVVIQELLQEFSKCFADEKEIFKQAELAAIAKLLD